MAIIIASKKGYHGQAGKFDWRNLGVATIQAIPSLSLIVAYALILSIFYRNITLKSFWKIVLDSAKTSGMIVFNRRIQYFRLGADVYADAAKHPNNLPEKRKLRTQTP